MSGVRFTAGGAKIPYDLLRAQERGEVVFLCGAGVSMTAGLPDFFKLTENIYARLGEQWKDHPAEAEGMEDRRWAAPDRTLFALQQRLHRGREQLRAALEAELTTGSKGTDAHYDLLRLSRDMAFPRLVTTNFDTLFERCWRDRMGRSIDSWAASGMPGPGSADFRGVFHLHGRLEDASLNLSKSELVLTSAEFGDAYLRSGWASRYLYDLLRHAHVVIVGYSLNDPPTRYLFEALSADRERFEFRELYALAPAKAADQQREEALWRGRGAIPLLYRVRGNDHSNLYGTLAGWADYADAPTDWSRTETRRILAKRPGSLNEDDSDRLNWILSRGDAERLLAEANPPPSWLGSLQTKAEAVQPPISLGSWIEKRLGEPKMIDAVLHHPGAMDLRSRIAVATSLRRSKVPLAPALRLAWRLIVRQTEVRPRVDWNHWFDLLSNVARGDSDHATRAAVCSAITPQPALSPRHRWPGEKLPRRRTLQSLATISFKPPGRSVDVKKLVGLWPPHKDAALLHDLEAALVGALEEAIELAHRRSTVWDVPSIASHPQNAHRSGFHPIIRLMVELWERLAAEYPSTAVTLSSIWAESSFDLLRRLWLHTLSFPSVYSGDQVAAALLALNDATFWGVTFQREVMRLMAERWNHIPQPLRSQIEARLIAGDPNGG